MDKLCRIIEKYVSTLEPPDFSHGEWSGNNVVSSHCVEVQSSKQEVNFLINKRRMLEEFLELVQVDSETRDEREICNLLTHKLQRLGFDVVEDDTALTTGYGSGNLIATLAATDSAALKIYFTCHMDTVAPGKGIKPSIQDDVVVSDGTTILGADDKAGLAALLEGAKVLQEQQMPHGQIQLVITVGEESGLVGSRHLDRDLIDAEFGFALDSTGPVGHIITSAPAQMKILATIHGKAAHAGVNPEDGISAIQVASRAISRMPLGRIDYETTANIGQFRGGTASNVVPAHVEILAEARSQDSSKLEKQTAKMVTAFQDAAAAAKAEVDVTTELIYPAFKYEQSAVVVQKAWAAMKRIDRVPSIHASGGGSDANVIGGLGVPTINLGIGYENIHTTSEKIPLSELYKAAELVVALIEECS